MIDNRYAGAIMAGEILLERQEQEDFRACAAGRGSNFLNTFKKSIIFDRSAFH